MNLDLFKMKNDNYDLELRQKLTDFFEDSEGVATAEKDELLKELLYLLDKKASRENYLEDAHYSIAMTYYIAKLIELFLN